MSLAALILLLVVALIHGEKYFHAGREMYVGERLVSVKHYTEALPHLLETIRIAPGSDKAVLLAAKAALLTGDVETADKVIQGHGAGHFEDANKPEFQEVNSLWNRAMGAMSKAEQAGKLEEQDGKEIEAARLMHEAATLYPENSILPFLAESFDEGVAFVKKDYDGFVTIAQKQWKEHAGVQTAAALSSALACKFAVTGDLAYKQQSEEMLSKAYELGKGNADSLRYLEEFAERTRYRLNSREIISRTEYNRKFRGGKEEGK